MLPYSYIHAAPLAQLLRWWDGIEALPEDFHEDGLDEVAYALSKHNPEGVQALKRSIDVTDMKRRWSALYFLAFPDIADEQIRAALIKEFYSGEPTLKKCALWGFIHLDFFPLERAALSMLINGEDQRLAALAMVYLSRAYPEDSLRILREALQSSNPRMREYACDEIGDQDIGALKNEMRNLLGDADPSVAEAAASNL
jgi:hypothetical protein